MAIAKLPPGVRAETFNYANGGRVTVYRAPFESDGPRLRAENGSRVLYYVYAAYVFRWPEGTTQLDVAHGTVEQRMPLFEGVTITGRWSPGRLAEFGQAWAADQFARFSR